jgi:hypothetical protein
MWRTVDEAPRRGRGSAAAALALLLVLAACGGGGGGGGPTAPPPPTPTPPPPPGVTLTAGSATGPAIVLAQSARSTATLLVLEVRASGVTGLYGVAFDLQFPAALFDYGAFTAGTFLAAGGATVSAQVTESAAGNLVVGLTRLGNVGGVDGSGLLLELELPVEAGGTGNVAYARNTALRADGSPLSLTWAGGSVTVVR